MIARLLNGELERMRKETAAASVVFYPDISLERLEKSTKHMRHICVSQGPPEQAASQPGVVTVLSGSLVTGRAVVPGDCMWDGASAIGKCTLN
jgi:hypothetical protein